MPCRVCGGTVDHPVGGVHVPGCDEMRRILARPVVLLEVEPEPEPAPRGVLVISSEAIRQRVDQAKRCPHCGVRHRTDRRTKECTARIAGAAA